MKIGYGYRRKEAELTEAGAERVFIDFGADRLSRSDMLLCLKPGDEVLVLYLRDLGGSPVADRVWREKVEAKGATVRELRPAKPSRPVGRPAKFRPTEEQNRLCRAIWLGDDSERVRLRRVGEIMGHEVGKGALVWRYGTPSNPKET